MKTSQQWHEEILAAKAKIQAIVAIATEEKRELTAEEAAVVDEIQGVGDKPGTLAALEINRERALRFEAHVNANIAAQLVGRPLGGDGASLGEEVDILARVRVPARAKRSFNAKVFSTIEEAYATGQWCLATIGKNERSRNWCREHGIMAAHSEGVNTAGGFLVPDFFESAIIRIVESFGVFRANGYVYPMGSDTTKTPRRSSGFTVYYVGENTAITASDMAFTQVQLVARKPAILTQVSSELNEDEVVGLASLMATEFGYALAVAEDNAGFNGDGTSTYGGIVGLKNALAAGSKSTAATGNTSFATLDLADFHAAKALMPEFVGIQPKWYISSQGFAASMEMLQVAAGGNTVSDVASGGKPMFLGSPVVKSQVLPTTLAAQVSTIVAYYGDLAMATTMGTRRAMRIDADSSYYFNQDAIAVRCTERYDIVVHEPGTASVAGPIVALVTPAS